MYLSIANNLATFLIRHNVVSEKDREVYAFGFQAVISRIGTVAYLTIAGLVLGAVPEAVVFYFTFMLSRKYAGGYHASTYIRCNATYLCTFAASVGLYRFSLLWQYAGVFVSVLLVFAVVTVWVFSPIENPNNPIKLGKRWSYRLYSLLLTGGGCLVAVLLLVLGFSIHRMVAITMAVAAVYMYVEVIKRRKGGESNAQDNEEDC